MFKRLCACVQGFLTGVLQAHARRYQIPINSLEFSFELLEESDIDRAAPRAYGADAVVVTGLWLEGASWDAARGVIADSPPGVLHSVRSPSLSPSAPSLSPTLPIPHLSPLSLSPAFARR